MSIFRIASNVPYDSNIYLVKGKKAVLIDAGTGRDSKHVIDQIWKDLDGTRLDCVLLTHCHIDHIGGLADIIDEFGCTAYIHESELGVVAEADLRITVADSFGINLRKVPCNPIHFETPFDLGDHKLVPIHTPGHTRGGVCFYDETTTSMFSGDTVFAQGFGRFDLPTGNIAQLRESLLKLRNVNIGTLYPGHGPSAKRGIDSVEGAIAMMEEYY